MRSTRASSPQDAGLRTCCPDCGAAQGATLEFCTECGGHLQPDADHPGLATMWLWTITLCVGGATIAYLAG